MGIRGKSFSDWKTIFSTFFFAFMTVLSKAINPYYYYKLYQISVLFSIDPPAIPYFLSPGGRG
jgi:hypothetical protein